MAFSLMSNFHGGLVFVLDMSPYKISQNFNSKIYLDTGLFIYYYYLINPVGNSLMCMVTRYNLYKVPFQLLFKL